MNPTKNCKRIKEKSQEKWRGCFERRKGNTRKNDKAIVRITWDCSFHFRRDTFCHFVQWVSDVEHEAMTNLMLQRSSCDAISGAHRIPCSQKNHLMFAYGSFHLIYKRWMEPVIDKKPHLEIQCWYLFDTQTTDLRMVPLFIQRRACVWNELGSKLRFRTNKNLSLCLPMTLWH